MKKLNMLMIKSNGIARIRGITNGVELMSTERIILEKGVDKIKQT